MRRSFVQFYSKQHHTTSLLDATDSMRNLYSRDTGRYDLRKRDPTSPELPKLNKAIQNRICVHKRQKWRDFVETMDQSQHHNPLQPLGHNLSDSSYMEVIINHPYTEAWQGHLPRNFLPTNLVNLPRRKSHRISVFPTINKYLIPAQDQHGFRREHWTTSALLQLTTDIAVGFNQRKPPDRTYQQISARWLSCYLRGRQAKTCFR